MMMINNNEDEDSDNGDYSGQFSEQAIYIRTQGTPAQPSGCVEEKRPYFGRKTVALKIHKELKFYIN